MELAYIDADGGGTVRIYDVTSGETSGSENVRGTEVDWSSVGDLAVVADGNLVLVDPDSGNGELLASADEAIYGPRWSPDGSAVAYSAGEDAQLFVVEPGSEPANFGGGSQPAWTADSARLAFAYEPEPGVSDIYSAAVTPAGAPEQLTTSITLDQWPSWSPDGTRVAYIAAADAVTAFVCIAQFGTPGGDCLRLPNGLLPTSLEWSPR
jgi:Tol biopolymer transport system component